MGHIHLVRLPATRAWREVVDLLGTGAAPTAVIAGSARAAEKSFRQLPDDVVCRDALRLLIDIPLAGRGPDFAAGLRQAGLTVPADPSLPDLVMAVGDRLDQVSRGAADRSDLGELSRKALVETLLRAVGDRLPGLLAADPADVAVAAAMLAGPAGFRDLARQYYTTLTANVLAYWLDRALAQHVGAGLRFPTASERGAFDAALAQYCAEATRIISEFATGWYAKNVLFAGGAHPPRVAGFGAVAARKITEELQRKHGLDA